MPQFNAEAQMCAVLEERLASVFGAPGLQTTAFAEVPVGSVIPDFLVVQGGAKETGRRLRLTNFDAAILAELLRGCRRAGTVARRLWSEEQTILTRLNRLRRVGLVREVRRGSFSPVTTPFSGTHVIAVEAKVSRWTEALRQAASYQTFSNESYVALPSRLVASHARVLTEVRGAGIGLLAVSERGVLPIVKAVPRRAMTSDFLWVVAQTQGVWLDPGE